MASGVPIVAFLATIVAVSLSASGSICGGPRSFAPVAGRRAFSIGLKNIAPDLRARGLRQFFLA